MKVLCVAEKPSIAKSITQILSGGQFQTRNSASKYIKNYDFDYPQTRAFFTVTAVVGHLTATDFPEEYRKWTSCDPFALFDAAVTTSVASDKKDVERNLIQQARTANMLMIWTDCDREGEHIGSEIVRVCRKSNPTIQVKRARFSAIIAQQIHNAAQHPVELDQRQADAVEARILLDLKIGAAFTRLQTLTLQAQVAVVAEEKSIISYGPCQFPTLGFVVQRYNLVKQFRPEPFWYIYLSLNMNGEETKFNWDRGHIFDREVVDNIFQLMSMDLAATVSKVTKKTTKKWKPLPLTTVELQKAGSRLLKMAPKKVLDIAEKLYQQGFVSYPRTETDQFDPQFDFMSLINKQTVDASWGAFATSLQNGGFGTPRRGKNDDKAHPPIHPTAHANNLNQEEKRVYEYITRRFLAACSKDAEGWQTTVEVLCGGETFTATGLIVTARNYLDVFVYDKWEGHHVPDFQEGQVFMPTICEIREGQTTKPAYLTEADLVTLMDKNGIGTDATIAQHIATIVERQYVVERMEGSNKYLIPSTLGIGLIEGYNRIGLVKNVSKPQLRRETERRMVQVCEGTATKHEMLHIALEQYKEMFMLVRREFDKVTTSVNQHLQGNGNVDNEGGGNNGPGGGGGGGGNPGRGGGGGGGGGANNNYADDGDDDDYPGGGAGASRGRGRGRARARARGATATTSTRGRGRGGKATASPAVVADTPGTSSSTPATMSTPSHAQPNTTPYRQQTSTTQAPSMSTSYAQPTTIAYAPYTGTVAYGAQTSTASTSATWQPYPPQPPPVQTNHYSGVEYRHPSSRPSVSQLCSCNKPAIQQIIQGDAVTSGKPFWACAQNPSCHFFMFVENTPMVVATPYTVNTATNASTTYTGYDTNRTASTSSIPAKRPVESVVENPAGNLERLCLCGEDSISRITQKEGANKGRMFWKCGKGACNFFSWDDEPAKPTPSANSRPNTGGGGGSSTDTCYKCNGTGHWAANCPDQDTSKRARSFGSSSNSSITCFKCNTPGHLSTACPNGGSGGSKSTYAGKSSDDVCYKCNRPGHWSKGRHRSLELHYFFCNLLIPDRRLPQTYELRIWRWGTLLWWISSW
ncbi:DNA topoisomerase [Panaeolus papilionaceus]|nr:DNA topoisomerase [Panaeolus papilionaceus]